MIHGITLHDMGSRMSCNIGPWTCNFWNMKTLELMDTAGRVPKIECGGCCKPNVTPAMPTPSRAHGHGEACAHNLRNGDALITTMANSDRASRTFTKVTGLYGFFSSFCKAIKSEKLAGSADLRHMYLAVSLEFSTLVFNEIAWYYMVWTKMMLN